MHYVVYVILLKSMVIIMGNALIDLHSNVLLGQITISNTRSKRVNDNMLHTQPIKSQYMQIFMFVGVSVIEILLFNRKKKKKMKNTATL